MRATIVLVIYKQKLGDSESFRSLMQNQALLATHDVSLVIHDNSPTPQALPPGEYPIAVNYRHNPSNPGLAAAYNLALRDACEQGHDWLLLLDQDTRLPEAYFHELTERADGLAADCVCLVPRVSDGQRQVSPMDNSRVRASAEGIETGYRRQQMTAINSGACWRTTWLDRIGGFNPAFPLDYLDHWAFHRALSDGQQVYVMAAGIRQNLSISSRNQVSRARYESIYESEYRYYSQHRPELFASYRRHLPLRLIKQLLLLRDKKLAWKTLQLLLRKKPGG
ncbi:MULTISPECIES: glycosyltransferase [Pseudomonas]|jgi:GT2 family glycosyltransferase|uniref:glycosyltransferase n=1 Tax=Pseudomonas TaxID=286 RepID=UPI0005B82DFE|nr:MULTISPECIES: glycosyltransferase [Pseudomonas]KWR83310.1 hypothetical protein RN02_07650 [Pseudomonas sp. PI1]WAB94421.1 glycosyltransferase [Pseudomonas citronellolis]